MCGSSLLSLLSLLEIEPLIDPVCCFSSRTANSRDSHASASPNVGVKGTCSHA